MNTLTKSHKLNTYIELAEKLGLEVTVEDNSDDLSQSYHVVIQKPQVEATNWLAYINNMDTLTIHARRYIGDGKPRAFRLNAREYTATISSRPITLRILAGLIGRWHDDIAHYQELTA